jgi:hypothetical protein
MACRSLRAADPAVAITWAVDRGEEAGLTAEFADLAGTAINVEIVAPPGSGRTEALRVSRSQRAAATAIAARTGDFEADIVALLRATGPQESLLATWQISAGLVQRLADRLDLAYDEALGLVESLRCDDIAARTQCDAPEAVEIDSAQHGEAQAVLAALQEAAARKADAALTRTVTVMHAARHLEPFPSLSALTLAFGALADARSQGRPDDEAAAYLPAVRDI